MNIVNIIKMFEGDLNIFKIALDLSKEGIFIVNSESKILFANKSVHKIFGYKEYDLVGSTINTVLPPSIRTKHETYFKKYIKNPSLLGPEHIREVYGITKKGTEVSVEVRLNNFKYEEQRYVYVIITDISKYRKSEKNLKKSNVQLQEKVKDHSEELKRLITELQSSNNELKREIDEKNKTKQELDEALAAERELNHLKSLFLSLASHEFRTPLSGIQTSVDLISKYLKEENESVNKHLIIIKRMIKQLVKVLDDFLSMDKIDNNEVKYVYTEFSIDSLITVIIKECSNLIKKGQQVHFKPHRNPKKVIQDKRIFRAAIKNLLFNAVKYSPEGSNIYINVRVGKYIYVQVKDEGIGIPENEISKIGERFYRASNAMDIKGTGLGIHIIKHNIESLGGSLTFESKLNEGTTFSIKLPNKKFYEQKGINN